MLLYIIFTAGFLIKNLLPVTLGNLLGGCAVAALFYSCYLRKPKAKKAKI